MAAGCNRPTHTLPTMATRSGPAAASETRRDPPPGDRELHARWLLELTQIPTVAGREQHVAAWISRWAAARPELDLTEDAAGNLTVRFAVHPAEPRPIPSGGPPPLYITAHMDHPAFVVERVIAPGTLELAFRGGVRDDYFESARVTVHTTPPIGATLSGPGPGVRAPSPADAADAILFKTWLATLDDQPGPSPDPRPGDIATWELPPAEIDADGIVHTHACDDLAALAAAVSAFDTLLAARRAGRAVPDVRLLFTRSEEIGFTGAIAACRLGTMPAGSRIIALENSRSFPDSPIGAGPIVRVGDRLSIFSPALTGACAKRAEQVPGLEWQRKLMAGGACEATVFCTYGYEATCICLPLGNYHNMANLQGVETGTHDRARLGPPRVAREFISIHDFHGLVDLLVAIGLDLPNADPIIERIERLYARHAFVLNEGRA